MFCFPFCSSSTVFPSVHYIVHNMAVTATFPMLLLSWKCFPFISGVLSDPGIQPGSPALQADSLPSEQPGKPIYFKSPNWGYLSCSQAKGSPSSKGTSSLFSPKTELLGIELQALSDSEINLSLQVKYLVTSAVLGPLEYVSLYFIFNAYPYLNLCNCMHFLFGGSGRKNLWGHALGKHDCQHTGPKALSPRNQRQQGRESSRAWTQGTY